jgi:RES domain-containing protein
MRLRHCRNLTRFPVNGVWYRAVRPQHFQTTLAFAHTATIPGRYNPGSIQRPAFTVLYLAEDPTVALFEVQAMLGTPLHGYAQGPNLAAGNWTTTQINVLLHSVVDLTITSQRRMIRTTVQELTGDWRGYSLRNPNAVLSPPHYTNVPTQRLGSALRAGRGLEGFITYSARVPTKRTLAIFPDRLRKGSHISFTDPATGISASLP